MTPAKLRPSIDRATLITLGGVFATQAALIISGVVVARALGPEGRGHLALLVVITMASTQAISLGLPVAIALHSAKDPMAIASAMASLKRVLLGQVAVGLLIPTAVAAIVFLHASENLPTAVLVAGAVTVASITMQYTSAIFQGLQRFGTFALTRAAPTIMYAGLALGLHVLGRHMLAGFIWAWAVPLCLVSCVAAIRCHRMIPAVEPREVDSRELVAYGLKAQVGIASPLENFQIDQMVVAAIAGPAGLGIYVVGVAFTNLPRLVAQSIGTVAFPRIAASLGRGARRIAAETILLTLLIVGSLVALLEAFMGRLVPFFFGNQFIASIDVARVMLIAALCLGMRRIVADVLRASNQPMPGTTAELTSWMVFGVLVFPLTSSHGPLGAAVALSAAAFSSLCVVSAFAFMRLARA